MVSLERVELVHAAPVTHAAEEHHDSDDEDEDEERDAGHQGQLLHHLMVKHGAVQH